MTLTFCMGMIRNGIAGKLGNNKFGGISCYIVTPVALIFSDFYFKGWNFWVGLSEHYQGIVIFRKDERRSS